MSRLGATANEAVLAELIDGVSDDGGLLTFDKAVKRRWGKTWTELTSFRFPEW
jgi:hypothetical protein